MDTVTVRVSTKVRRTLQELAEASHRNMQSVLADAVEEYRRRWILDQTNAAYARLASDKDAWEELEEERRAWEGTLGDGVENDQ